MVLLRLPFLTYGYIGDYSSLDSVFLRSDCFALEILVMRLSLGVSLLESFYLVAIDKMLI